MLNIFRYLRKQEWLYLLYSVFFIVISVWLDLKLPGYMSKITILVQTEGSSMADITLNGVYMLLCALGSMLTAMVVSYLAAKVAAGLAKRLRGELFRKTMSFSMEEINGFSTASLITRSTNDISQVQMIIAMGLQVLVRAPIMAVWAILKIYGKNWEWTMATGAAVVFLLFILSTVIIFALPKFKIIQRLTDNLNRVTREHLTGLRVVRAYNAEPYQDAKFEKANAELTATNLSTFRILAIMFPSIGFIMSGIGLAIYWIGAYLINAAQMQDRLIIFSDMVVFSSYAIMVIMSFMMLAMIFVMLPRAAVSAKRINEVLETEAKIVDGTRTESLPGAEGEIEFRNVGFRYPDAGDHVLRNISFKARKGETVAIIGSTGSGKTTLVNLVPRFYDATEGEVIVGGINVKEYSQEALRKKIGYVSQRAVLFSGTIASNVMIGNGGSSSAPVQLGRSANAAAGSVGTAASGGGTADTLTGGEKAAGAALDAEQLQAVKRAVEIAQSTEFIEKMEGQYEANVSQGGANLSGGQKQRLSIARAIYRNPEIYIFDDTFSALDYRTDRALRAALKRETAGATTLIVAQRIGTIKDADKIIVLEDGEIAGIGTHDELMATCRTYQEIAYSQLSKEELAHERQ